MQPSPGAMAATAAATAAVGLAPDLQKRVKIMAEHVARNGPDFEATVKSKNAGNPQFAFLANGEGSEYYNQLLQAHRLGLQQAPPAAVAPPAQFAEQQLLELANKWREPQVLALGPDRDRQLSEIIASLEQIASRDAIRAGRAWIEANAGVAHAVAGNLMKRIAYLPTCAHRLHILFLLHDLLQTELTKPEGTRALTTAFKPFLVWMLRPSYQMAQSTGPDGDESAKILKLVALWAERGILNPREAEEVRTLVTVKDLPRTGSLLQQVGAQLNAQQARPPASPQPVLGILQQLPPAGMPAVGMPVAAMQRPPGAANALPVPGFTGVIRPTLALPQQGSQTPETVPVGVMATMLKQVSKRGKDLHTAFVPYKPLDPLYTPQTLPPVAPPTARLMERLAEYYDLIGGDAGMAVTAAVAPPAALAAAPAEVAEEPPPEEPSAEKRAKGKVMCASGSRSRSRSRSGSEGKEKAADAVGSPEAPKKASIQAID